MALLLALGLAAGGAGGAAAQPMAPTPPLGWNPWYRFGCGVNEQLIEQTADSMASSRMHNAGFRYVVIDDCWMSPNRAADGSLQPDPVKFPHGIAAVAEYVHAHGLKLGIYIDAGSYTCAGFPGSAGHYLQDAKTLASWNVDYVKVDWCHTPPQGPARQIYDQVRDALDASGREMVLAVCNWGVDNPWQWAPTIASSWRTAGDYNWYGAPKDYWRAVLAVADINASLARYAHPSAYNDPDILLAGTGVLNARQERSQFGLWSMMAAPLMIGADLRRMPPTTKALVSNAAVVAVDQDRAGLQGLRVVKHGTRQVWVRRLADGSRALLLLNGGRSRDAVSAGLDHLGLPPTRRYAVRDLWGHRSWTTSGRLSVSLAPYESAMFRVWP
jgi:alpha-galactosidase